MAIKPNVYGVPEVPDWIRVKYGVNMIKRSVLNSYIKDREVEVLTFVKPGSELEPTPEEWGEAAY